MNDTQPAHLGNPGLPHRPPAKPYTVCTMQANPRNPQQAHGAHSRNFQTEDQATAYARHMQDRPRVLSVHVWRFDEYGRWPVRWQ